MDNRHFLKCIQLGAGILPTAIVTSAVVVNKPLMSILAILILILSASMLPLLKRRANLWAFVFTTIATIPLNIFFITMIDEFGLFFYESAFMSILFGVLYYCVLFSLEQIAIGVTVRLIRDNTKNHFSQQNDVKKQD